jgi:hypothetical protein
MKNKITLLLIISIKIVCLFFIFTTTNIVLQQLFVGIAIIMLLSLVKTVYHLNQNNYGNSNKN